MKLLLVLMLICGVVHGETNIAITKLKSKSSKKTIDKVTTLLNRAAEKEGSFKIMDYELIEILSQSQGFNSNCSDKSCYAAVAVQLGVDQLLYGSFTTSKKSSSITLSLYSTETEAIEVNHTFSYKKAITKVSSKTFEKDIKNFLNNNIPITETKLEEKKEEPKKIENVKVPINLIISQDNNTIIKVKEEKQLLFMVNPIEHQDEVIVTSDNEKIFTINGTKITGVAAGKATLTLSSKLKPEINAKVTVQVQSEKKEVKSIVKPVQTVKKEPKTAPKKKIIPPKVVKKQKTTAKDITLKKDIEKSTPDNENKDQLKKYSFTPQVVITSQYNGPTVGLGFTTGYNIGVKHTISLEADYGYMPEFFYNQNTSYGAGIGYSYNDFITTSVIDVSGGLVLGYWYFMNDKYSDHVDNDPDFFNPNRFIYVGGPKLSILIAKKVTFVNNVLLGVEQSNADGQSFLGNPDFKAFAYAVKTAIGYKFNF